MTTSVKWIGSAVALAMLIGGGSAFAQPQNKDQQKCINTLNKDTCKVAAKQGKENSGCVKAGTKGTAAANCLTVDAKGKVGGAKAKTLADETKNDCLGANAPNFGYAGGAAGNTTSQDEEINLFEDTYGTTDPTGVISTNKLEGGCQSTVTKDLEKIIATKWKQYVACKKNTLKLGAASAAALEACLSGDPNSIAADPKGKIAKARTKLDADIAKKCTGVSVSSTFPGDCSGETLATLDDCLDARAECRVCLALNATDGLNVDCDLFDDGLANGSCGISFHKCVLAPTSGIAIYIAALPVPLAFAMSGALDIGAGGNVSLCNVQAIDPINIPSIGNVCITPGGGCPVGTRWCGPGPGPALGIDVQSDGNTGACTSNAACQTICNGTCGGVANVMTAGCTGQCSGTTPQVCTSDAACLPANGACNGPDPVSPAQANICQCSCVNTAAHGPSDPGDMQCRLGSSLVVESASPCDGTDITIQVGTSCIPVSTQRASALITDANFIAGSKVPNPPSVNDQVGNPVVCGLVDNSVTTGLIGVGAVNFFGSALGDLSVGLVAQCL